jgi:hypothetical protein
MYGSEVEQTKQSRHRSLSVRSALDFSTAFSCNLGLIRTASLVLLANDLLEVREFGQGI